MFKKKDSPWPREKKTRWLYKIKNHLSDEEQSNLLANHFSNIPNEYIKLKKSDVKIPKFPREFIFQIKKIQVWNIICHLKQPNPLFRGISLQKCIKRWLLI